MTWPTHGTGSTTPEDGREDPDYEDYEDPDSPRRGRHAYPDPLPPIRVRGQRMLVHLLGEPGLRAWEDQVRNPLLSHAVATPQGLRDGGVERGALVQQRPAHVDVVQEHVRGQVEARVADPVGEPDLGAAQVGLDPPVQHQVLREDRRLVDLALRPENAAAGVPPLAVAGEPGGDVGHPAVQPVPDILPGRVVVFLRANLAADWLGLASHAKMHILSSVTRVMRILDRRTAFTRQQT